MLSAFCTYLNIFLDRKSGFINLILFLCVVITLTNKENGI